MSGIAGSVEIGAHCRIGGGVLIADHAKLADKVCVVSGTGVPAYFDQSGVYASGTPVVPYQVWLRNMVQSRKPNEGASKIRPLERVNSESRRGNAREVDDR